MKKLPKTVFVKMERFDDEETCVADIEAQALVCMGDKIQIGRYQLVETILAEGYVRLSPVARKVK